MKNDQYKNENKYDTPSSSPEERRFAVLLPHRDILPLFRDWQARLASAGLLTVWAFPPAAPLAALKHPLDDTELKELARKLRGFSRGAKGRPPAAFLAKGPPVYAESGGLCFGGLALALSPGGGILPDTPGLIPGKVLSPILLCAFMMEKDPAGREGAEAAVKKLPPPELSFRAAAVANLVISPLIEGGTLMGGPARRKEPFDGVSFAWKLGKPRWLPRE